MGRIGLKIQPGASRDRLLGLTEEGWKLAVQAPPVDGKANQAVVRFLAKLLDVPRSQVRLVHGAAGRRKLVEIDALSDDEIERRLTQAAEKA